MGDSQQVRQKATAAEAVLPPVAEFVRPRKHSILKYTDLDGIMQSVDYRELAEIDTWPLPTPVDREGYGSVEFSFHYWATGHGDLLNVQQAIDRYCQNGAKRVLDFGCSTGRFLRHVKWFSELEPNGCDFAPANIDWVNRHLGTSLNLVLNSAKPELPFADDHFDVVTAFSVFTHIDQDTDDWLNELLRVTKRSGLLYLTIQNQASWDLVLDRPGAYEHIENANRIPGNIKVDRELFQSSMPADRIVFRMSKDDLYNCNVWCSNDYVQRHWLNQAELLGIADNAHTNYQSVVLLRPIK